MYKFEILPILTTNCLMLEVTAVFLSVVQSQ